MIIMNTPVPGPLSSYSQIPPTQPDPWLSSHDSASPTAFEWKLLALPVSVQALARNSTLTQTEQRGELSNRMQEPTQ